MRKRDLEIINNLEMFRVMSRNDIVDLHFSHLKNAVGNCNQVLKRLVRDKQIEVSTMHQPYVYFPPTNHIKKDSTKIPHFLKLVQVYKDLSKKEKPTTFQIEPKYRKGLAEPDIYTIFRGKPFFIEVQRSHYNQNQINDKLKRYEALKYSDIFNGTLPTIILITPTRYAIDNDELTIIQTQSIQALYGTPQPQSQSHNGIKFRVG